ncbi:MAG: hypothetical protein ABWK00_06165, partial [Desulfurococcaceae archaeon]
RKGVKYLLGWARRSGGPKDILLRNATKFVLRNLHKYLWGYLTIPFNGFAVAIKLRLRPPRREDLDALAGLYLGGQTIYTSQPLEGPGAKVEGLGIRAGRIPQKQAGEGTPQEP